MRLTATPNIICAAIVVVLVLITYHLLGRLVSFGRNIDYSALGLSVQATELIQQYQPIFWWAIAIVIALFVASMLYRFVKASYGRAQHRVVNTDDFMQLMRQLSPEAKDVLAWAWEDRRYPVTVGVLQRTIGELNAGRAGKIHLARAQAQALQTPNTPSEPEIPPAEASRI